MKLLGPGILNIRMVAASLAVLAFCFAGCGSPEEGGTTGATSANSACEAWCRDPSCVSIHQTDDFSECMFGCTNEQSSPSCVGPYSTYISCLAGSGCLSQCTGDAIAWAACEDGGGGPGTNMSISEICKAGCGNTDCQSTFVVSSDRCEITCLTGAPDGCEEVYRVFMQCKLNDCRAACRNEALAFSSCAMR